MQSDVRHTPHFASDSVILTQTDTTVGLLSQSHQKLASIKRRPQSKPFLKVYSDLAHLKADGGRIPRAHRSRLRHARKTTYVVKGAAFRIVTDPYHLRLLNAYGWLYSTSANLSGHGYEQSFCEATADIIIEDKRGLYEGTPSRIERLGRVRRRRLR